MWIRAVIASVALGCLLSGCKTAGFFARGAGFHQASLGPMQLFAPEGAYELDSGDKLRITVFGQETLSRLYTVDASGYIAMPLIGTIRARGLSTVTLSKRITALLNQDVLKDAEVTVEVETYRPFFILGEVRQPGQFAFVPDMTVETAVAIAGGFTERANEGRVRLTRRMGPDQVTMVVSPLVPVLPGDTIYILERFF